MTKRQENEEFVKMLKEFPKAFGRVSFRERLMLRTAFTYVVEEVMKQERVELENHFRICEKNADTYYDRLTRAKGIIRALLFHLNKDTFAVIYETQEESIHKAEQFLKE